MIALAETLGVVLVVALRNLFSNRWKTLIMGGVIGLGAMFVVLGASVLDGVDRALESSIVGSSTGHVQIYSRESRGELDILGGRDALELAPLVSFAEVRAALSGVPGIRALVPMGTGNAYVSTGNALDQALASLRRAVSEGASERVAAERARVRRLLERLRADHAQLGSVAASSDTEGARQLLVRASSEAFWSGFDAAPFEAMEFLENRVAPLEADADRTFLRFLGTDPAVFARAFDRMTIADGEAIPAGKRGLLIPKYVYEHQLKRRSARGLDEIQSGRERGQRIASDPALLRLVSENVGGAEELLQGLDDDALHRVAAALRGFLKTPAGTPESLLAAFFRTDDASFDDRYRFFYQTLAPQLPLYRIQVGDTVSLRALTRDGYVVSTNLKVYGTYAFRGLETSPQAGALSLTDLVSFRELAGLGGDDRRAEMEAMREAAGARDVTREDIEANLLGGAPEAEPAPGGVAGTDFSHLRGTRARHEAAEGAYDPVRATEGPILSVAVLVDESADLAATARAIESAGTGAGLPLRAATWQEASGMLGRFTTFVRLVLFAAVAIAFAVALLVVNNALVMATLERVRELGTLRAIGAQRSFLLTLLVAESGVSGLVFGGIGGGAAACVLWLLHRTGIPAGGEALTFLFSGPRLFPVLALHSVILAIAGIVAVSIGSGLYPGLVAMRVSPREAIQAEE